MMEFETSVRHNGQTIDITVEYTEDNELFGAVYTDTLERFDMSDTRLFRAVEERLYDHLSAEMEYNNETY